MFRLSGKTDENLLQCRVTDSVVLEVEFFAQSFHEVEQSGPEDRRVRDSDGPHGLVLVREDGTGERTPDPGHDLLLVLRVFRDSLQFDADRVSLSKARPEMLRRPETLEATGDHNGDAGAEVLTLCHRVRGQDDGAASRLSNVTQSRPDLSSCCRIDSGCRFVQKDDLWTGDQGDGQ